MKAFLRSLVKLDNQVEGNRLARESLLRSAGWKCSSDYPGALWLWSKSFPESEIQWIWRGQEKIPHPGFDINGATTEAALHIEASWQNLWTKGNCDTDAETPDKDH
jgi:hypothetical protein